MEQLPFSDAEFVYNPEPRCPCILLLDTSFSMSGEKIKQLNQGLLTFMNELKRDDMAVKRVEITIVTFGPVCIFNPTFRNVDDFIIPNLEVTGSTPMGEAIVTAINLIEQRKNQYRGAGIQYYRPWIFFITDGAPTDDITEARDKVHLGETKKGFLFFSVGVEGADMNILRYISHPDRTPLKLKGLAFQEMFMWLSSSLSSISRSRPDDAIDLINPKGWGSIEP